MSDGWHNHLALGYGRVVLVDDTGPVQTAQVKLSAAETRDKMPMPTMFGFASNPPVGSDVVFNAPGGQRSNAVGVAHNHQQSRRRGLSPGASCQHDSGGRQVLLANDGLIQLFAPGETLHRLLNELVRDLFNTHTHHGGPVPDQQMTDAHLTAATRAGT